MNLPNVSDALLGWTQSLLLKTVTTTSVDFVDTTVVTGELIEAVVQPTKLTNLNKDTLDWTRDHFTFHSVNDMRQGQLIEYKGRDFKVVDRADYSDYGYYEVVAAHTREPLLEVTQ